MGICWNLQPGLNEPKNQTNQSPINGSVLYNLFRDLTVIEAAIAWQLAIHWAALQIAAGAILARSTFINIQWLVTSSESQHKGKKDKLGHLPPPRFKWHAYIIYPLPVGKFTYE